MDLPRELTQVENLPTLPAVAIEVLRLSKDEHAEFDDYAKIFARDPALAAKLLQLANSPLFALSREVTDLAEATTLLGLRTVQIMALGFSLVGGLPRDGGAKSFAHDEFWRRSVLFAVAARELGVQVDRTLADEAFLCGLLSHIGQLVLAHAVPMKYERVLRRCKGWPDAGAERDLLGFDHHDVADAVLRHWGIPEAIRFPVVSWGSSASPGAASAPRASKLATLMTTASHVVSLARDEAKGVALADLHAAAASLRMPNQQADTLVLVLEHRASDALEMMDLPPGEPVDHYALLAEARDQALKLSLGAAAELSRAERRSASLQSHVRRLTEKLTRDPLTGLGNRNHFDEALTHEVRTRMRSEVPKSLGLLVVDVDRLAELNDSYGEAGGDEILRAVGKAISGTSRATDVPARIGGDEFAVIAPSTDPDGLLGFAVRLRGFLADLEVNLRGRNRRVGVSIGGACIVKPDCEEDAKRLLEAAESQLGRTQPGDGDPISIAPLPIDESAA